jgi:hypothetical protein
MSTLETELSPAIEKLRTRSPKAHRPELPERARPMRKLERLIEKRVERGEVPCSSLSMVDFLWDARARQLKKDTVYIATLRHHDLDATLAQVRHYQDLGVPNDEIVIVGDYRNLAHRDYAALKHTGAMLKRVHDELNDGTRARIEYELLPIFQDVFNLTPHAPPVERLYTSHEEAIPLDLEGVNRLVRRISDPDYEPTDE